MNPRELIFVKKDFVKNVKLKFQPTGATQSMGDVIEKLETLWAKTYGSRIPQLQSKVLLFRGFMFRPIDPWSFFEAALATFPQGAPLIVQTDTIHPRSLEGILLKVSYRNTPKLKLPAGDGKVVFENEGAKLIPLPPGDQNGTVRDLIVSILPFFPNAERQYVHALYNEEGDDLGTLSVTQFLNHATAHGEKLVLGVQNPNDPKVMTMGELTKMKSLRAYPLAFRKKCLLILQSEQAPVPTDPPPKTAIGTQPGRVKRAPSVYDKARGGNMMVVYSWD
nr:hypothetical protein [Salmonid herpesvirus 1]